MTVASGRVQTAAVIAALEAAGLAVGDGVGKDSDGADLQVPYIVVYADLGVPNGSLGDPFGDLDQTVFIHGIGSTAEQAQWAGDKARTALLGQTLTITGRATLWITCDSSQPVQRDDSVTPSLYFTVDQLTVQTTPA